MDMSAAGAAFSNGAKTHLFHNWQYCLQTRSRSFLLAAQLEDQFHDELFDLVPRGAIQLVGPTDRIVHLPLDGQRVSGDWVAADVDHQVEIRVRKQTHRLRKLGGDVDVLFGHRLARFLRNNHRRSESGAVGRHDILAVLVSEAFGHLAAAGVAYADEQYPLK